MAKPLLIDMQDLATLTGLPKDSPELALAAKRASSRFYGDTHRGNVVQESTEESYNGDGGRVLLLRGAPVTEIHSFTVDGHPLTEHFDYTVDRESGIIKLRTGVFTRDRLGNIRISYTHGYKTVPGDVEDAVLEHAVTLAMVSAFIQQEGAGSTQASYAKEATVGTTQKWVDTVARYNLDARS